MKVHGVNIESFGPFTKVTGITKNIAENLIHGSNLELISGLSDLPWVPQDEEWVIYLLSHEMAFAVAKHLGQYEVWAARTAQVRDVMWFKELDKNSSIEPHMKDLLTELSKKS